MREKEVEVETFEGVSKINSFYLLCYLRPKAHLSRNITQDFGLFCRHLSLARGLYLGGVVSVQQC